MFTPVSLVVLRFMLTHLTPIDNLHFVCLPYNITAPVCASVTTLLLPLWLFIMPHVKPLTSTEREEGRLLKANEESQKNSLLVSSLWFVVVVERKYIIVTETKHANTMPCAYVFHSHAYLQNRNTITLRQCNACFMALQINVVYTL